MIIGFGNVVNHLVRATATNSWVESSTGKSNIQFICVVEQPKSEPANTNAQRIELVFFIDSQLINILRKDKEFSGKWVKKSKQETN